MVEERRLPVASPLGNALDGLLAEVGEVEADERVWRRVLVNERDELVAKGQLFRSPGELHACVFP